MATVTVTRGVRLPEEVAGNRILMLAALRDVLPPRTVFSDLTAAELHGLWLPPRPAGGPVHVTVPAEGEPARQTCPQRLALRSHRRHLAPSEVGTVAGLPVTTIARTWRDLAGTLLLPDLVAAGDSALRSGVSAEDLAAALATSRGSRGRRVCRQALPLLCARSRSRPETHLRVALVTAGLPAPAVNLAIHDDRGQWLAEPDLAYPAARLAVEYQGLEHADPERMRRDLARQLDLHRAGWLVLAYGSPVLRACEAVIGDVLAALTDRAPALLARR